MSFKVFLYGGPLNGQTMMVEQMSSRIRFHGMGKIPRFTVEQKGAVVNVDVHYTWYRRERIIRELPDNSGMIEKWVYVLEGMPLEHAMHSPEIAELFRPHIGTTTEDKP